jgi:hypothetical protein
MTYIMDKREINQSSQLEIGDFSSMPRSVFVSSLERDKLSETSLVSEAFLFTFPQVLFVLFGERTLTKDVMIKRDTRCIDRHCLD